MDPIPRSRRSENRGLAGRHVHAAWRRAAGTALIAAGAAAALGGCISPRDNAVFVTKTSVSVVDADTAPAGVSIAYDRVEGYVGPRFDDGNVFPVASALETRGSGFGRTIRQVYATGNAARIVTGAAPVQTVPPAEPPVDSKVMLFATGTTAGLRVGFADGTLVPSSFTLGYKRKEASVIPVDKFRHPSVLASFDNASSADVTTPGSAGVGFGVEQFFATGDAAVALAGNSQIRALFQDKATRAIGNVEIYRIEQAKQRQLALDALGCLTRIGDEQLDRIWNNAEDLGVFGDLGSVAAIRREPTRRQQRDRYLGELSLLDANSASTTDALAMHKKVVCDFNKPNR